MSSLRVWKDELMPRKADQVSDSSAKSQAGFTHWNSTSGTLGFTSRRRLLTQAYIYMYSRSIKTTTKKKLPHKPSIHQDFKRTETFYGIFLPYQCANVSWASRYLLLFQRRCCNIPKLTESDSVTSLKAQPVSSRMLWKCIFSFHVSFNMYPIRLLFWIFSCEINEGDTVRWCAMKSTNFCSRSRVGVVKMV